MAEAVVEGGGGGGGGGEMVHGVCGWWDGHCDL